MKSTKYTNNNEIYKYICIVVYVHHVVIGLMHRDNACTNTTCINTCINTRVHTYVQ